MGLTKRMLATVASISAAAFSAGISMSAKGKQGNPFPATAYFSLANGQVEKRFLSRNTRT